MRKRTITSTREMDWNDVPDPAAREMLRQGETYLKGLLAAGIGADQRATTLCGIFGAVAVALLAAAATIASGSHTDRSLIAGLIAAAVPLFLASFIFGRSGRPIDFYIAGYEPAKLLASATSENWMIRYVCEDIQRRIEHNREVLHKASVLINIGFGLAIFAIPFGIAMFLAFRHWTL